MTNAAPPAPIAERYLAVPESVGDDITELATEATERHATPYEKAVQLQEFFTKKGEVHLQPGHPAQQRRVGP